MKRMHMPGRVKSILIVTAHDKMKQNFLAKMVKRKIDISNRAKNLLLFMSELNDK